jgi:hypothetical protein
VDTISIREKTPEFPPDCIHCYGSGCVHDALEDEAHECWMCLGTGRKMSRTERMVLRADLERPRL